MKERFDCKRYIIPNVVYISYISKKYIIFSNENLYDELSKYGSIKKIIIHNNNAHIEFFSQISANLCIKYLNNFKKKFYKDLRNVTISYSTTLTKTKIDKYKQMINEVKEPVRYCSDKFKIFPDVSEFEKLNFNLICLHFPDCQYIINLLLLIIINESNQKENKKKYKQIKSPISTCIKNNSKLYIGTGGIVDDIWIDKENLENCIFFIPKLLG